MPSYSWTITDTSSAAGAAATSTSAATAVPIARDIQLDLVTHDVLVTDDLQLVAGGAAIAQAVKIRLLFFKEEWFLDLDQGMPYWQEILGKKTTASVLRSIFRDQILDTPGILELPTLSLAFNGSSRELAMSFKATTDLGELNVEATDLEVTV